MMGSFAIILLYALIGFVTGLFGLLFSFLLYLHYIHKINEHLPGPPRSSFIFGHIWDISHYRKSGGTMMEYLLEQRLHYGPVYVLFFVHRPVVFFGDYTREVLIDNQKSVCKSKFIYDKIGFVFGQRCGGHGLISNMDDVSWRKRRQLMNPSFHRKCLKNFMNDFNEVCDRFMVRMSSVVEEQETSMAKEFAKVTLDVISQVSFNINVGAIEDPNSPFSTAITSSLRAIQANFNIPLNATLLSIFQFRLFQTTSQKQQIDAVKFLRKFAYECASNRINDIQANKDVPEDLLSVLVNDKSLSMDDIIDEFLIVFIAGQETTGNSLAFTLYEITQNPDVEAKLLNELNDVLGSKEYVAFEDLAKLKYLGQVLQESLRKYPVAGGPVKELTKEITVGGYRIPKGNAVNFEKYMSNHNPDIWKNPDIFDPERFSEPEKIPNFSTIYFPFSIGPRNCIGLTFAKFESKVILARILRKFQFQLLPGQTSAMEERLTIAPRDGVMCKVMIR